MTKVLKTDLLKITLANIQKDIRENIWSINQGGCGYFATYLAAALKKYDFKFKVAYLTIYSTDNALNVHSNIKRLNNGGKGDISTAHVLINIGKSYVDGTDTYNSVEDLRNEFTHKLFHVNVDVELFKKAIEKSNWNTMYNTDNNEEVEKIIFDNFKKIFG